jgi:hypothetical protein
MVYIVLFFFLSFLDYIKSQAKFDLMSGGEYPASCGITFPRQRQGKLSSFILTHFLFMFCLLENTGIEPVTFGLQSRRSPN